AGGTPRPALQFPGVVPHRIEHAPLVPLDPGPAHRVRLLARDAEKPLENRARPDLRRVGGGGRAPGDAVAVRAAIPVVAIAALDAFLAAQLERRKSRLPADLRGGVLIDRHSGLNILAEGLFGMGAGK